MAARQQAGQTEFTEALALHRAGRLVPALAAYEQFLAKQPLHIDALYNRGVVLQQLGRLEEALAAYTRVAAIKPEHAAAHYNRGIILHDLKRLAEACSAYDRAIALRPDFLDAYYNRGVALHQAGRPDEALASYDAVVALRADYAAGHYNRGVALRELGRLDEALASFDRATTIDPRLFDAHHNRGIVLQELGRPVEALASFDRALALRPDSPVTHDSLGLALHQLDREEEALASYDRALALKPAYARAHRDRGDALVRLSRPDEALLAYQRAIAIAPDDPDVNWNKGLLKLRLGEFDDGWKLYEWRWRGAQKALARQFAQPLWLGEQPVAGKTILIAAEQGLGDFIQFCRYVPMVAALGAEVVLETPAPLMTLMTTLAGDATLVRSGDALPSFDLHCPIMSLPLAFKTDLPTIPAPTPYLRPDATKAAAWARRLGPRTKPRVGLVWSTGFRKDKPEAWRGYLRRNIPLREIAVLGCLDIEFFSLQKGEPAKSRSWRGSDTRSGQARIFTTLRATSVIFPTPRR